MTPLHGAGHCDLSRRHRRLGRLLALTGCVVSMSILSGPASYAASEPCRYDVRITIDPERNSFVARGRFVLPTGGWSGNSSPLQLHPAFVPTEHAYRESTGASGQNLAVFDYHWEGWPVPGEEAPIGPLSHLGSDHLMMGPGLKWSPPAWSRDIPTSGRLVILVPERYRVLVDGHLVSDAVERGFRRIEYQFERWYPYPSLLVVSRYPIEERRIGPVLFRFLLHPSRQLRVDAIAAQAERVLDTLTRYYGEFPDTVMTVVEAPPVISPDFLLGSDVAGLGMSGVVVLAADQFQGDLATGLLAHELAHQWWGNLTRITPAGDEFGLWMTEGMAEHASLLVAEAVDGGEAGRKLLATWSSMARNVTQRGNEQPLLNVSRSERSARSIPLVYSKAPYVIEMMRCRLGDERFAVMVRAMLDEWHGQQPTIRRMIESMDQQSGDPWRPFLEQWIERRGLPRIDIDYAVAQAAEGRWAVRFAVRQAAPAYDLTLPIRAFGAGAPVDTSFVLNAATQGFSMNLPWDPSTVTIDPDGRVLIGELTVTRVAPADLR